MTVQDTQKSGKGFTLIELMIAITVVSILATIGMLMYTQTQKAARDAKRKADLEDIKRAVYLAKTANGGAWCKAYGCAWSSTSDHATNGMNNMSTYNSMGTTLVASGYLKSPAHDPNCPSTGLCTNWTDYHLAIPDDINFTVSARLETAVPVVGCTPASGYNYCISQ